MVLGCIDFLAGAECLCREARGLHRVELAVPQFGMVVQVAGERVEPAMTLRNWRGADAGAPVATLAGGVNDGSRPSWVGYRDSWAR